MEILRRYLVEKCHLMDPKMFRSEGVPPTETEVMEAIGWRPVIRVPHGEKRMQGELNWDDENWQMRGFKEDFEKMMKKGAKSWGRWCKRFGKDPEKAVKK